MYTIWVSMRKMSYFLILVGYIQVCSNICVYMSFFVLDYMRRVATCLVFFCEIERRFHGWESNRQPLHLGWGTSALSSSSIESFQPQSGFVYHAITFIRRRIHPSTNMVQIGIDPNNNLGIQRFSHLQIPIKYQSFDLGFNYHM